MSSAPKRPHEEAGSHSTPSKYPHEDSSGYPKVASASVSNDYHHPPPAYEIGQDGRTAKIPRIDSRDSDRRSPLHSSYRSPSSTSNDAHKDSHMSVSDVRMEARDSKETREVRVESREPRAESRDFHGEAAKREYQSGKGEKEVRFESRGEDAKELNSDAKVDVKVEKDGYGGSSSHSSWKDSREQLRGKRPSEVPGGGMDQWQIPRGNMQGPTEVGKEGSTTEQRDHVEAHEAVGENKFDPKGEDRFKDKERKRKDGKYHDWGDKDKERSDRRSSNIQIGNSGSREGKDSVREERESERWERERKDLKDKERERLKEREKDHVKRESITGTEKDEVYNVKELKDGSVTTQNQENSASEQRKQKEVDNWKNVEREAKDKKQERDVDAEGDRSEKRNRGYEKESDDGSADVEGATEREREGFNYGVQQRKRMLRPRGSPQVANREPRFRSQSQENEG